MDLGNILVVDDEEAIREVVSTMLESRGYQCTSVSNGRAAQECVKKQTPDLVLSDMIMPEMDGIACIQQLMAIDSSVSILVISALSDKATGIEALKKGARGFLCKPFTEEQLLEALTELTED